MYNVLERQGERYHLAIPVRDAIAFALGESDLGYATPDAKLREVVGWLAVDQLEYSEQWRAAAMLRACLAAH